MPMRYPLTELSLDKFTPLEHRTSTKRPLSPSAALLSPSKRRILSAEGLYSPEKKRISNSGKQLLSELVSSPSSPARRLDFAALSHPSPRKAGAKHARDTSSRPETPVSRTGIAPKLAPSPEIASGSSSDASTSFGSRLSRTTAPSPSLLSPLPSPMVIPREMPLFADRQSIHWPGFDVHVDTHITIPTSDSINASNTTDTCDVDDTKENDRPRRRAGKMAALGEGKAVKPVKLGRTEKHTQEGGEISIMSMSTPSPGKRATMTLQEKQQERKQMKLIMVSEMDEEEDDVDNQL